MVDLAATATNALWQISQSAQKHDDSRARVAAAVKGISPFEFDQQQEDAAAQQEVAQATEQLMPELAKLDDKDYKSAIGELRSAINTPPAPAPTMPEVGSPGVFNILASGIAGMKDPANAANYMGIPFEQANRERGDRYKAMMEGYEAQKSGRKDRLGQLGDLATLEGRKYAEEAQTARFNANEANTANRYSADRASRENIAQTRETGLTLRNQNTVEGQMARSKFDFQKKAVMAHIKTAGDLADPKAKAKVLADINGMLSRGEIDPDILNDPEFNAALSGETLTGQSKATKIELDQERIKSEGVKRQRLFSQIKVDEAKTEVYWEQVREMPEKLAIDWMRARNYASDVADRITHRGRAAALAEAKADVQNAKIVYEAIAKGQAAKQKQIDGYRAFVQKAAARMEEIREEHKGDREKFSKNPEYIKLLADHGATEQKMFKAQDEKKELDNETKEAREVLEQAIGGGGQPEKKGFWDKVRGALGVTAPRGQRQIDNTTSRADVPEGAPENVVPRKGFPPGVLWEDTTGLPFLDDKGQQVTESMYAKMDSAAKARAKARSLGQKPTVPISKKERAKAREAAGKPLKSDGQGTTIKRKGG